MNPKAIEILNKDQGFFLMVEAGRIDQAHHETWANRALEETLDLDEAIEIALKILEAHRNQYQTHKENKFPKCL